MNSIMLQVNFSISWFVFSPESGRPPPPQVSIRKNFAFIEFSAVGEARAALEALNGTQTGDRLVGPRSLPMPMLTPPEGMLKGPPPFPLRRGGGWKGGGGD